MNIRNLMNLVILPFHSTNELFIFVAAILCLTFIFDWLWFLVAHK